MGLQALVVQQPTQAVQLVLLFHGEFTTAQAMLPLAHALAAAFPQALVACIEAPYSNDTGSARQWLDPSAAENTDAAPELLAATALPAFLQAIGHWQARAGVAPQATALVGFGHGATLVLESTQTTAAPASRVVAIAGRFANLPETDRYRGSIHFLHGKTDTSVPYQHTVAAAHRIRDLGGDLTAEVIPFVGHELHADFIEACVEKLSTHIALHLWEDAQASPQEPPRPH